MNMVFAKAGFTDEVAILEAAQEWPTIGRGMTLSKIRENLEAKTRAARSTEKTEAEELFERSLDEANAKSN